MGLSHFSSVSASMLLSCSTRSAESLCISLGIWVQHWVQAEKEKWLPISRKRHQIRHLDFSLRFLLAEGLLVRI